MDDTANVTLNNLRAVIESLEQGNLKQALSVMEKMNPSCPVCNEYLTDGKTLAKEAIINCPLPITDTSGNECKTITEDIMELVNLLEAAYAEDNKIFLHNV